MKEAKRTFDEMNLAVAKQILQSPESFGGAEGFPACWARLFMARLQNEWLLSRAGEVTDRS